MKKIFLLVLILVAQIYANSFDDGYYWQTIKKDNKKAVEHYTKAIAKGEDLDNAYYNRGVCYDDLHKYDLAIADYKQAIIINPKDKDAYHNLGLIYLEKKRYDEAKVLAKTNCDMGDCELSDLIKKEGY
ncbi:MAG: tetratricopeptide repeat protein [Sulfurovaceae bacterium]|nr:tetratricopeptide repeat protein [Sulfurovaceae bacterium]MDD5548274.1 tetratricopeptide repeat protein [Sulfurovaceae bacterium]